MKLAEKRRREGELARRERRPEPMDIQAFEPSIRAVARKMHGQLGALRVWDPDDLVQEVFLKAMVKLDSYRGESSLKTWVVSLARNHLISMARASACRPRSNTPNGNVHVDVQEDHPRRAELRRRNGNLLGWLRQNPDEVKWGWEVLNLLLWNHGDYPYVATAMSVHTREPWTVERVRQVVRRIEETEAGRALCESLGVKKTQKTRGRG